MKRGVLYYRTIIPYQELLGNYDIHSAPQAAHNIIPYQELLGNYDLAMQCQGFLQIIPYQELLGNYDMAGNEKHVYSNYTIPRAIREL